MNSNPFTLGGIVRGVRFAGRVSEVKQLRRLAESGERAYLFAPRRYGKTSLLREALVPLAERGRISLVWCDCLPANDVNGLTQRFAAAVVEAVKKKRTSDWIKEAGHLFTRIRPSIAVESDGRVRIDIGLGPPSEPAERERSLEDALRAAQRLADSRKRPVAVVFDEFQQLVEWDKDARAEAVIRTVIQTQSGVSYFFAGSQRHLLDEMFADRTRPLYKMAAPIPLGRLDNDEILPWLHARFGDTQMKLRDDAAERIMEIAAGHPWAVQYLSHFVWEANRSSGDRSISVEEVGLGLDEALRVGSMTYESEMSSLTATQRRVLAAIAVEPTATPMAAAYLQRHALPAKSSVSQALGSAMKRGLVELTGDLHVLSDPLLAEWIRRNW